MSTDDDLSSGGASAAGAASPAAGAGAYSADVDSWALGLHTYYFRPC